MLPLPPNADQTGLCSKAAQLIVEQQAVIMDRWENAVREDVPAAQSQETLLLRNNLLSYIEFVVRRLRGVPAADAQEADNAAEASRTHGRLRATLAGYSVEQVIDEYIAMRRILADLLAQQGVLDVAVLEVLSAESEKAIYNAVKEFNNSLQTLRQKAVSMLMHDIRNPLNVITITAETVQVRQPDQGQDMQRILQNGKKIDRMVGELLDAVRLQAGQGLELAVELHDVSALVQLVVDSARVAYPDHVIEAKLGADPIMAHIDSAAVTRAVENLVSNAVKYGSSAHEKKVSLSVKGSEVHIAVHNWGNPIEHKEHTRIFVAFERSQDPRANRVQLGWGLGLTYVKAVAEGHGGHILLDSTPETGTVFTLVLPVEPKGMGI